MLVSRYNLGVQVSDKRDALSSKKFWAFLLSLSGWDVLIGMAVVKWFPLDQWETIVLLAMLVILGVLQVGYILSQAGLDALSKLFDIITPDAIFGRAKAKKEENAPPDA